MPEIAEVETIYRQIEFEIAKNNTLLATVDFYNKVVVANPEMINYQHLTRIGKYMLFTFVENQLLVHLGMTGRIHYCLLVENTADEIAKGYAHTRGIVTWYTADGQPKFRLVLTDPRNFGKFELYRGTQKIQYLSRLGIDPLNPDKFTLENFRNILHQHDYTLAKFLIQQDGICGIGNYLRSEIMFDAGINPFRYLSQLTEEDEEVLFYSIKRVVDRALHSCGFSLIDYRDIYGNRGNMSEKIQVYQRNGFPCPNCGDMCLITQSSAEGMRRIFFCNNCQT